MAGDEHQQGRRGELREPDEAKVELAPGGVEHELAEGDGLHDRAPVREGHQREEGLD